MKNGLPIDDRRSILFIDNYDPTCSILENKDKAVYIKQRVIEIAT